MTYLAEIDLRAGANGFIRPLGKLPVIPEKLRIVMAVTEALSQFLATPHTLMEERKSEGHNTDQFPGDGYEKVLDVCRSGLCALTCSPRVRARPWHCSDDAALLGALRIP